MNRKIKIAIIDFDSTKMVSPNILTFIKDRYEFEMTTDFDADYVFHSCHGYEVLKHSGVRVFVTGENVSPNFNISDYALAFDKMEFGDRYKWFPLFRLYTDAYQKLLQPRREPETVFTEKTMFCAYVMSNMKNSAPERTEIVDLLDTYKSVSLGGKWRNNVGGPVKDKLAFQSKAKFVIAFENSSTSGYLTEKFAQAAEADAIPIYWGDPTIAETFNPNAFINCHDFDSFEAVLEEVKRIDQNDELYLKMIAEPWFPNGKEPEELSESMITKFLIHIFDQPHETAFRRNRSRWGIKYEKLLYRMYNQPLNHGFRRLRTTWLNLYHKIIPKHTHQG